MKWFRRKILRGKSKRRKALMAEGGKRGEVALGHLIIALAIFIPAMMFSLFYIFQDATERKDKIKEFEKEEKDQETYYYKKIREKDGDSNYIFIGEIKPVVKLKEGELKSLDSVNEVLNFLDLPPVKKDPLLGSEKERNKDLNKVEKWREKHKTLYWKDYKLGTLVAYIGSWRGHECILMLKIEK